MCLTPVPLASATSGLLSPTRKLHIHFETSTRFSYSGEGMILLLIRD